MKTSLSGSTLLILTLSTACTAALAQAKPLPAYDALLTNYSYPYKVSYFHFHSQKQPLKMAYMDVHPKSSNGQTVLLLHGKNFSGAYWKDTIQYLASQGYRVVVPDQIGFGKSSKPRHYQFSFHGLASNTQSLLGHLKVNQYHVVGHSMGGMLATRLALMDPAHASKLVLVNPIGLEDWKSMVSYRTVEQNYRQELKATPQSLKAYQQKNYFDGQWKPQYDALVQIPAGWTRHPDYPRVAWNSALTSDMIFTQPVLYEFGRITVPTLLIIGQKDRTAIGKAWAPPAVAKTMGNYPALGKKAARSIPGSTLVEIPAAGHLPQVETYGQYRDALAAFLKH